LFTSSGGLCRWHAGKWGDPRPSLAWSSGGFGL